MDSMSCEIDLVYKNGGGKKKARSKTTGGGTELY